MLGKLRLKFIALNMTIAALVLVVVFGAICVIDYQTSVSEILGQLNITVSRIAESYETGKFGQSPQSETEKEPDASSLSEDSGNGADDQAEPFLSKAPTIGKHPEDERNRPPAAIYLLHDDGSKEQISASTASLSDDLLESAFEAVARSPQREGLLENLGLFYSTMKTHDGMIVAFADESSASSWQSLALTLAGVGTVALIAFFLISIFFSRWALKPVETAWNQQQRFVADASHELKTPLTVILANSAILKAHPDRTIESQSQWVDSTQSEALRMQELVNDMLELARPASIARENPLCENVDFTDLVENLALQFESVAFEKGVTIESELEPNVILQGDKKRLQRLASTLIDNACKYARSDSVVTIRLNKNLREASLSVHNDGQSIPTEDLPHIFDRFYRTDKARTSETGGFGLGLAIAREVAKEHDGDIVAESSQRKGTTFTATLALRQ